jgi:hypothetical protein
MSLANILVPNNFRLYIDSPVIQGSLIPDTDNTYDLGSNILRWKDTNTYDLSIKNSRLFVNSGPNTRQIDIVSPAPNDVMTTNAGVQTLTNKTYSSGVISGTFTGTPLLNGGIQLQTSGGVPTTLNYYEQLTVALTFSAGTGNSGSINVQFTRVGNIVHVWIPSFAFNVGVATPTFIRSTAITTRFRPTGAAYIGATRVQDNGTAYTTGFIYYDNLGGTLDIYKDAASSAFTSGTSIGLANNSNFTYSLF